MHEGICLLTYVNFLVSPVRLLELSSSHNSLTSEFILRLPTSLSPRPLPLLPFQAAFEAVVEFIGKKFSPDLVIVAAGYDAAKVRVGAGEAIVCGGCKCCLLLFLFTRQRGVYYLD